MPEKWDASKDARVIAVKEWGENTGWHTWTDDYTDDEIAMLIQFTRTEEGAIKKFCRQVGIELSETLPEPVSKEGRRSNFVDLHDHDQWAIEHQAAGEAKRPTCSSCFLIISATGMCNCEAENDNLVMSA